MPPKRPEHELTDEQRIWRHLDRPDLVALAASYTMRQLADMFGVHTATVRERLKNHGLMAKPHEFPVRTPALPVERIKRCPAPVGGARCGAPLDADGTCRWTHQHDESKNQP